MVSGYPDKKSLGFRGSQEKITGLRKHSHAGSKYESFLFPSYAAVAFRRGADTAVRLLLEIMSAQQEKKRRIEICTQLFLHTIGSWFFGTVPNSVCAAARTYVSSCIRSHFTTSRSRSPFTRKYPHIVSDWSESPFKLFPSMRLPNQSFSVHVKPQDGKAGIL